jgi:hypothetical protein
MGRINIGRVVLGGLLAGLILNISEAVLNLVILAPQWAAAMQALGKPADLSGAQIAGLNVREFMIGIVAVWIYAGFRPRFGAGVKTAIIAGITIWLAVRVSALLSWTFTGVFPLNFMLPHTLVGLLTMVIATIAGAWLYKEEG